MYRLQQYIAQCLRVQQKAARMFGVQPNLILWRLKVFGDTFAPGFETKVTYTQEQFKQKVLSEYANAVFNESPSQWIDKISRSSAGGVITAEVCGKNLCGETHKITF